MTGSASSAISGHIKPSHQVSRDVRGQSFWYSAILHKKWTHCTLHILLVATINRLIILPLLVRAESFHVFIIHRTLTWTTGSLSCVRDHSYAVVYTQSHKKLRLVYLVWFQGVHKIFVVYESPLLSVKDVKHRVQLRLVGGEPCHTHTQIQWFKTGKLNIAKVPKFVCVYMSAWRIVRCQWELINKHNDWMNVV